MDNASELSFSLANETAIERIETAYDKDLGTPEAEKFGDAVCEGFVGRVGTTERARDLGIELQKRVTADGKLIAPKGTRLLVVPHHFSIARTPGNRMRTVHSVGVIADYKPNMQNFSIIDVLPNAAFHKLFETKAVGELKLAFSSIGKLIVPQMFAHAPTHHDEPRLEFGLDFGFSLSSSYVNAMGVGTTTSMFEFFSGKESLEGQDLTACSVVLFNERAKKLDYRIRMFFTTRVVGLLPKLC
jgi:hypothetical protein